MKRRDILTVLAGLGAVSMLPDAWAQSRRPAKPYRVGFAYKLWPEARERLAAAFREHG